MEIRPLDLDDPGTARAVLALQRRAYRVEAEMVGSDAIPPLHESLDELRRSGERFAGAFVEERLTGVVSWKLVGETLDLHRLAVDPNAFRRGLGRALVLAALAAEPGATRAVVQTGSRNEPACRLYRSLEFAPTGEREVAPGLVISLFERSLG